MRSFFVLFAVILVLPGCATKRPPTVAHTHIGHVLTGWHDTPNKEGLFVAASKAAADAVRAAESAAKVGSSTTGTKASVALVIESTDPAFEYAGKKKGAQQTGTRYGVKNALEAAVHHVEYATTSPDASPNIKSSAPKFASRANFVLERCDLTTALGDRILRLLSGKKAVSPNDIRPILEELVRLTRANEAGDDSNGDGVVGSVPEEFGLKQVHKDLMTILDRESPPYATVDSWYLFNLVRLPSGEWIYRKVTGTTQRGY
jgi:hypothetical protein